MVMLQKFPKNTTDVHQRGLKRPEGGAHESV